MRKQKGLKNKSKLWRLRCGIVCGWWSSSERPIASVARSRDRCAELRGEAPCRQAAAELGYKFRKAGSCAPQLMQHASVVFSAP